MKQYSKGAQDAQCSSSGLSLPISKVNGCPYQDTNNLQGRCPMTLREAIRVLMQSPFYFRMELSSRKVLVKEFCRRHAKR